MRIGCWIPKATSTNSEYEILIASPLQQWLHDRASLLRYTYSTGLIKIMLTLTDYFSPADRLHTPLI